ncbi:MAG TPA: TRAP transporter small permease subunit, partial [Steroidobacteraceae bacterium]|nr:TRAP transporter small permease subunit [Steroidobacteraceae bacterium]
MNEPMTALRRFVHAVDALNEWIGRGVAWLTLGCVLTCFAVVVLRYAFDVGYPWLQELYVWQHATVFMVGAGYTMLHRGHVNVDLV